MLVAKSAFMCGGSVLAVAIGLGATHAYAADAAAAAEANASATTPSTQIGELVVVAQKREQNIESVPVAITAFSDKQRDILGIKTTQDLANFTPGLNYYSVADEAYIRGIGRNTVDLATAAGVATYYNGIYYGANATIAIQKSSLFIGNVEVDNGPQNTLHGSNADGGVIAYTSNKPTSSFYAEGRLGVGNYGYVYGEAVVSGPINDHWKFRVGGSYSNQGDGFFQNLNGLPNEGGYGPQGNGGRWHYWEAQIQGNYDHFDVWGMVSSGEYNTNFHTVQSVGNFSAYTFFSATGGLFPTSYHGICALNNNATQGCTTATDPNAQPVVLGSAVPVKASANQFPGNNPSNINPYAYLDTTPSSNQQNNDIAIAVNATYHFPGVDVEYLGGYQTFNYNLHFNQIFDAGIASYQVQGNPNPAVAGTALAAPLTIFPSGEFTHFVENDQYFSNEVDVLSTEKGPFQYLFGGYEYHEHFDQPVDLGCYPFQVQLQHPLGAPANPSGCTVQLDGHIAYDDLAGFAHASYDITPQFTFAGGIRYTWDHRYGYEQDRFISFDNIKIPALGVNLTATALGSLTPAIDVTAPGNAGALSAPIPGIASQAFINPVTGFAFRFLNDSWQAVTGDATLNWKPDSSTLGYIRYARGYKAGGFNAGQLTFPTPATKPEYVDDFEGGIKKTWGSHLLLNVDAYYYNWFNDQVPLAVLNPVTNVINTQFLNIPESRLFGVELLAQWRPIDPLTLSLTYGYENSRITNMAGICLQNTADPAALFALPGRTVNPTAGVHCTGGTQNITGNVLPQVTPNKITFNAQYDFHFDPGTLTLAGTVSWWDATFDSLFNDPLSLAPSYTITDFSVYWNDAKDRYTLRAYINNAWNALAYNDATPFLLAPAGAAGGETGPGARIRTLGLTFPVSFGGEIQVRFR
jgi:iron complex outermembrane receptor protein